MSRVALIGENSVEYIDTLLTIWNSDDCAVMIDWRIPPETCIKMMKEADVNKCFIDEELVQKMQPFMIDSIKFVAYRKLGKQSVVVPDYIFEKFRKNYTRNEAVIIYSSGTTGKSKGIILSHFAINTNADAIIDYMNPSAKDCIYIAKTFSHSSTLTGEILVALKTHTKFVVGPTIVSPRYVLNNISKFGVTIICLNPTLLSMYADECAKRNYATHKLKAIYVSGSILNEKIYNKAHRSFGSAPIYNVYGLSEAGPRVTAQLPNGCKNNSVGKAIKGVRIIVFDGHGNRVQDGQCGIIHIKTSSMFDGYVTGKEKYSSLCTGWYNTGDVGYIDDFGDLHVVGRSDDVIMIDSHKICPSEVEEHIITYANSDECVVVKINLNDNEYLGCLYVSESEINKDIIDKLKVVLMPHEIPRHFIKCNELPKTLNGKISRDLSEKLINNYIQNNFKTLRD